MNDPGTYAPGRMTSGECALTALPLTSQAAPGSHYLTLIPLFTYPFLPPHFPRALPCKTESLPSQELHAFWRGQGTGRQMINSGMF